MKYFILLTSFILLSSCENSNVETKNKNTIHYEAQNKYGNRNYPINTSASQYQNIDYNTPQYISGSNNYHNYEIDESIRQLQIESKMLYENQMKEIKMISESLHKNSSSYEEYKNKRELDAIIAETNRMINQRNNIESFMSFEKPYIPEPINLPTPSSYSTDYVNPNANPVKIDVSGYTKSDGTYVAPHIRTAPNDRSTDNLRYPY